MVPIIITLARFGSSAFQAGIQGSMADMEFTKPKSTMPILASTSNLQKNLG